MSDILHPEVEKRIAINPIVDPNLLIEEDDPAQRLMRHAEIMLAGGTLEMGHDIANAILKRIENDEPLKHSLILQADRRGDNTLHPSKIPINTGILEGFGMTTEQHDDIVGNSVVVLGKTGLTALMQPLWSPRNELTNAEVCGLRKRLMDENGNRIDDAGIVITPLLALRVVMFNAKTGGHIIPVNDLDLTIR